MNGDFRHADAHGVFLGVLRQAFEYREMLPLDVWAERHRVVSEKSGSPNPGPWRHHNAPHLVAPMRAFSDPAVRVVVVMCPPQVGKTEFEINAILQSLDYGLGPVMQIMDNDDNSREMSDRLVAEMRATPCVASLLSPRPHDTKAKSIVTAAGTVWQRAASSPSQLANKTARLVVGDEVDKWSKQVKAKGRTEGSAVGLAMSRADAYGDLAKYVFASSPTELGEGIDALYQQTDRCRRVYPCPMCGMWQLLEFLYESVRYPPPTDEQGERLRLDDLSEERLTRYAEVVRREARQCCIHCKQPISNPDRARMLRAGREIGEGQELDPETGEVSGEPLSRSRRGFQLSWLDVPNKTPGHVAEQFVLERGEMTRDFQNRVMGRPYEQRGEGASRSAVAAAMRAQAKRSLVVTSPEYVDDERELILRAPPVEDPVFEPRYPRGTVPPGVLLLAGGMDVQKDRVKAAVWGFGRHGRAYLIDFVERKWERFDDNGFAPDAMAAAGEVLAMLSPEHRFPLAPPARGHKPDEWWAETDAFERGVACSLWAVDSGHWTEDVYELVSRCDENVVPVKGWPSREGSEPLRWVRPEETIESSGRRVTAAALRRERARLDIDVDRGKSQLHRLLVRVPPAFGAVQYPIGPGNKPDILPHETEELTAEREVLDKQGRRTWKRIGSRKADYLDASVYAHALVEAVMHEFGGVVTPEAVRLLWGMGGGGPDGSGGGPLAVERLRVA